MAADVNSTPISPTPSIAKSRVFCAVSLGPLGNWNELWILYRHSASTSAP